MFCFNIYIQKQHNLPRNVKCYFFIIFYISTINSTDFFMPCTPRKKSLDNHSISQPEKSASSIVSEQKYNSLMLLHGIKVHVYKQFWIFLWKNNLFFDIMILIFRPSSQVIFCCCCSNCWFCCHRRCCCYYNPCQI